LVDQAIARGIDLGPLMGVPCTVKANIDQQGFATTNGLAIQSQLIADTNSPVVDNIIKSGGLIIGRTNTPAFSMRWFTSNQHHGNTLNPRNNSLTPGGSSGGGAAAAASGMGIIAHGTDIAGSIRYPAYACGIHGLRPSFGRVPAHNFSGPDRHIGAQVMAVSGPMARSVADVRLAFSAMIGEDIRDPWHLHAPLSRGSYMKKVALCTNPDNMNVHPQILAELYDARDRLEQCGWIVEECALPPLKEAVPHQLSMWLAEMLRNGGETIERENDPAANEVFTQLKRHAPETDLNSFLDTLQYRAWLTRQWRTFLQSYPLVLCPVSGALPFENEQDLKGDATFDQIIEDQMLQIAIPFMGLPGMTVTTNTSEDVPCGVQLIASHYREDILLDAAEIIGKTTPIA